MRLASSPKRLFIHTLAAMVWIAMLVGSQWIAIAYDTKVGTSGDCPARWPLDSSIPKAQGKLTLVMFLHPQCPCSRATVSELEKIMSRAQGRLAANVLFIRYKERQAGWEQTALWNSVHAIPGVATMTDVDGKEAARFGAQTSGQTLVYDEGGKLIFNGGITASRGHAGDNFGQQAVQDLALKKTQTSCSSLVFGCPMFDHERKR